MGKPERYSVIFTTCGTQDDAGNLARLLVERHLAACVQMTPVTSVYEWEGKINKDQEVLLLIKAKKLLYHEIEEFIVQNHRYDIPEIIEVPIENGLAKYLGWIDEVSK
ncbi:MAG: divalent-cation tolerance protein CutA [Deltaproteobacteria bacterium]|nr:divalent-cation tolerance protein CutA [Deltaproteobacteria bacterium]